MSDSTPSPIAVAEVVSTPCLKKNASRELIESIRQIEDQADQCFHALTILALPSNVALWALLVGGVHLIEREIDNRGDNTPQLDATLINASNVVSIAMKWVMRRENHSSVGGRRNWTLSLAAMVNQAIELAHNYGGFLNALPMWHKNRYGVELISPTRARFTVVSSEMDRRISAYQKGFRPTAGRYRGERAKKIEPTEQVRRLFEAVYASCTPLGHLGFLCNDPWKLWAELLHEYQVRVEAISRRHDSLSLGDYTLGEFKKFYAAFLAVCATQEHLCFAWGRNNRVYPNETVVMVRSLEDWSKTLSNLSRIKASLCRSVIKDLTFDFSSSPNLHVCPFVPLDSSGKELAVAPHFPLHSRPDENVLWVCSKLRPAQFDAVSLMKEPEMYVALKEGCSRYSAQGPIRLPKPTPDIDFLLTDERSSTVVIAELKWIRKPTKILERLTRDDEVLKGFDQLRRIRQFVKENPAHLVSIGKMRKLISEYENVHYAVIARDHWIWVPPSENGAIFTYDAFTASTSRSSGLKSAVDDLLTYDWLPIGGRDYEIRYDKSIANGAEIETETFYAI